ncbi:MAG TPA: sensor histidine kinase [Paenibacillaceae bacterium]
MKKWLDRYRHLKIRHKLTLLISLIVAVSFVFTALTQQYAFSVYDRQLHEKSSQVLNLSSSAIESELKRLAHVSFNLATDPQIQELLLAIRTSDSGYERYLLGQRLIDRLIGYAGTESYIRSIQMLDAHGSEHRAGLPAAIPPEKWNRIRTLTLEAKGDYIWVFPDEHDRSLILARDIRSFRNTNFDLQVLGTAVIRLDIGGIVGTFAREGKEGLVLMAGPETIYPAGAPFDPADVLPLLRNRSGYFIRSIDGKAHFFSYIRSSDTGWTYINLTPYNVIFQRVVLVKQLAVAVFALLFVLLFLWGIRFSRGLTRPIEDLIGRMKLVEKGNFSEAHLLRDAAPPMDEIGLLHRTFRRMVERINTLITENYANRLLLKETEFKALQAQINPHFLYNTLESINWLARVNGQAEISRMVEALGYLLRNAVSMKQPLIPLADELEIVRHYVTIQKYRYEDRLDFSLQVPKEFLHRRIPKLSLQPLLENAFKHALEPGLNGCRIAVRAYETEDAFCVAVEDDGPGMPPDILDKLRAGTLRTRGQGIGLRNIDERIRIAFGEAWGLQVESGAGRGTRVILRMPKEAKEVGGLVQSASG